MPNLDLRIVRPILRTLPSGDLVVVWSDGVTEMVMAADPPLNHRALSFELARLEAALARLVGELRA